MSKLALQLRELHAFRNFSDEHLAVLEGTLEVNAISSGQVIYERGKRARPGELGVHIIVSGSVSIYTEPEEKNRVPILRHMHAGDIFGLVSFVTGVSHTANCKADTDTMLATLTEKAFGELRASNPELVVQIQMVVARQLARDLRFANRRLSDALQNVIKWEDLPGLGRT